MSGLEQDARSIFAAVVADCDPAAAFNRAVECEPGAWTVEGERLELGEITDVRVLASGKTSPGLVGACVRALDLAGVPVASRRGVAAMPAADVLTAVGSWRWLDVFPGRHPYPDAGSFDAGRAMLELCSDAATPRTLVLALFGGGGSAMAEWPIVEGATVEEFAELNRLLVRSDLSIGEINAVRKRISAIKGGRLAITARPARILTFLISDVACGDTGSVASGPTIEDESTRDEALRAIARLNPDPESIGSTSRLLLPGNLVEPPVWSAADRDRARTVVLLDARDVSTSATRHAERLCDVVSDLGVVDGPVDSVARLHLAALSRLTEKNPGAACAVVSSGEATVDVRGGGSGGRNQHLALVSLAALRDRLHRLVDFAILSAGTDGVDGNSKAAGAVAGPALLNDASAGGLDALGYLANFDSAGFFSQLGGQIICGPTGTNVRDLRVFIGVGR